MSRLLAFRDCHLSCGPSCAELSFPSTIACPTLSDSAKDIGVIGRQLMPMNAMSFSRIRCRRAHAPKNVDLICDSLQMIGVDTRPIPTEMVRHQIVRNRPKPLFIHPPMSAHRLAANGILPIPVFIFSELPNPARRLISAILFDVKGLRIWLGAGTVALQESHRLTDHPSVIRVRNRSWIRRTPTSALAELNQRSTAIKLRLPSILTLPARRTKPHAGRIRSLNLHKGRSLKAALADSTGLVGTLWGHRSGPFARVTRSRWCQPRGGFSLPKLYQSEGVATWSN